MEKQGDSNMFKHGYDPTRLMEIFNVWISKVKNTKLSTPPRSNHGSATTKRSPHFSSGNKLNAEGSQHARRYQFGLVNPNDVDRDDLDDDYFRSRPLASYEYIYPSGTAPKKCVAEDKIEAIHKYLWMK